MSVKTPSAVVAFENVPADAADPVVDVYVNGEKVDSGGGGGGDDRLIIIDLGENDSADVSYNDVINYLKDEKTIVFLKTTEGYPANLALWRAGYSGNDGNTYFEINGIQQTGENSKTQITLCAYPEAADSKPLEFIVPD